MIVEERSQQEEGESYISNSAVEQDAQASHQSATPEAMQEMDIEEETPTPQEEEEFGETGEKIQTTAFGDQNPDMEGEGQEDDGEQLMNTHHSFGDIAHQAAAPQEIGQSASQEALLAAGGQQSAGFGRSQEDKAEEDEEINETPLSGERESHFSYGTGSFTTGTFNARLAGSEGMKILRYIQDENFGKHGESMKLIDNIQVSNSLHNHTTKLGIHCQTHC